MNEREAIARLKRGDIGGLEALVRKYQVQAVQAAYLIARDRQLAEDIVQTAFLRAYERIDQFDADRPFGPWFLRSVVNDAVKAVARQQRRGSGDNEPNADGMSLADMLADPSPGPEEVIERAEGCEAVREALGKLTPPQRAVVVLRYYVGLTNSEIAGRLGVPSGTVKWHLHAARERLKALLRPALRPLGSRRETRD